jgi:hypothetical protein
MKPKNRATHLVLLQRISKGILWLEVRRENESLVILSAGLEPSGESESDDQAAGPNVVALRAALGAINPKLKLGWMTRHEVVVIVPSHRLTARFLDTPPVEEDSLDDLVAFEVSEALQVPIGDIAWDMIISSRHGDDPKKKLLWIAARKGYVDNLVGAWPEDRLAPTQVTPDFWSYYEFLLGADDSLLAEPAMIVSREGDRASITIADRASIYLTRSVPLKRPPRTGDDLEGADAEEYALSLEIERTLFYAADRSTPAGPKSLICCGFEDWKMDRMQMVSSGNGLKLQLLTKNDLLTFFSKAPEDVLSDHLSLLCIAYCQLKLDRIGPNLLEVEEEKVDWKSFIPEAALPSTKFMAIGGGLLAFFLVLWIGRSVWFDSAISARLSRGDELIKLANQLQKEEVGLRQLARTNIDYAGLFLFMAKTLPEGIFVKNLNIDAKTNVELTLTGGNNQQAVDLLTKLNESPYFRDMVVDRSVVEKEGFAIYLKGKLKFSRGV